MDVTLNQIKYAYRHLYYENGPVRTAHLLKSVANQVQARHVTARLVGLAAPGVKSEDVK